jgi:pimeloyl-ACP methyl ester carboxylesterase
MLKRIISRAVLVLLLCLFGSALFNLLYLRHLRARYPAPGNFYTVNGKAMHIYCIGQGSPTVVIEPGLGGDWLDWQHVQPELSKTTRVCTYDRLGNGWSETEAGLHDAVFTAPRLQALLQQSGEKGPFVLIGASLGGYYVREFNAMYPHYVAGIVFSDASIPEQVTAIPDRLDSDVKRKQRHRAAMWQWVREASGWERLQGRCHATLGPGMEAYAEFGKAESCRPGYSTAWLSESDAFWISAEQAEKASCCGSLPLVIISQDPDRPKPGWDAASIAASPICDRLQENLKTLSPHSRRIIARGAGHHVMFDRPDVIVSATAQLINELRQNRRDPQEGTTIVQ